MTVDIQAVAQAAARASERLEGRIRRTPLLYSPLFSEHVGARVWLKLENLQYTGSFKLRGATNLLAGLNEEQRSRGVVAASSGNHGAGVACAAHASGTTAVVFVPEGTPETKRSAIRRYGGTVREFGSDGLDTELHARDYAARRDMTYVSPYNDFDIIAGQGSCGAEIADVLPDVDEIYVAVGGGGLIGGVGSVLKSRIPAVRVVACQPRASAVMARSVAAGRILDLPSEPTLSDGTAGGIEPGSITFDICRAVSDEFVIVDEQQIAAAMRQVLELERQLIEGAAGVAVAAMLSARRRLSGRTVVVLICGGNVSPDVLGRLY